MRDPLFRAPAIAPGLRIGLYGGSFNPPHIAHLALARTALRRLRLDQVWWLVSPGNPLKDNRALPPVTARAQAAEGLAGPDRRIRVTALEATHGLVYTADTVAFLVRHFPQVRFVWLMGADSLATFHRWRDWQRILETVPVAIIDRPGFTFAPTSAKAPLAFPRARLPERAARTLADRAAPAWVYLHGPRTPLSSTALRARGEGIPGIAGGHYTKDS